MTPGVKMDTDLELSDIRLDDLCTACGCLSHTGGGCVDEQGHVKPEFAAETLIWMFD